VASIGSGILSEEERLESLIDKTSGTLLPGYKVIIYERRTEGGKRVARRQTNLLWDVAGAESDGE
jgi:hypothetical protein